MPTPDLSLDYEALRATRDTIRDISQLLRSTCDAMADVNGAAMGVRALTSRLDEFGDEWDYGIGQLSDFSEAAADAIDDTLRAFQELDEGRAAAVSGRGGTSETP